MSAIDQVIARARQGDVGFSERKQFKLARRRAIEKLRRFALADPYFYILEIIQAAIAGGADFVDISCGDGDVLISWTGGALKSDELAQLFDFLFASKERLDLAHVRSLALGVNALMLFEPEQVVIESGDGSPGGTARMVVRAGAESVDVGKADGVLNGTYVRATKLDRVKVAAETGRRGDDDGGLEYATVESRCLTAPVPLVFNGQSLFGWSSQRVPNLFGYRQVRSLDEGDLYGTIGLRPTGGEPAFQLLTHGVWIQSYQYDLIPGQKLGGVICFDRLHKTVDHSGFVRDDRFEEMWVRLRPYAEALVGGKPTIESQVTSAEGLAFSPAELRALLREQPRVVVAPPPAEASSEAEQARTRRGKSIALILDAQLLRVPDEQVVALRVLGGRDVEIFRPRLDDDRDLRFYAEGPIDPPAGPRLLPPVELDCPTLDKLCESVYDRAGPPAALTEVWTEVYAKLHGAGLLGASAKDESLRETMLRALREVIGETGTIRATLRSPVDPGEAARGLLVRVTAAGRLLGRRLFTSAYPGRVLDVELPTARPALMRELGVTNQVAARFAALVVPILRDQDRRALAGLGVGKIEPDTAAAALALQVLARVTVVRLRAARPGRVAAGLSFSLLREVAGFDPFVLPLLRTVAGRAISLRELALMTDETAGLVYGTIPEVPADLDGLDRDKILALDAWTERILITMLGESGYVRVDARDVVATSHGLGVRDVAIGLRDYPEFPILVEVEAEQLAGQSREAVLDGLVTALVRRVHGEILDRRGTDPRESEEHRRQAVRHLQWYACRELAAGNAERLAGQGLLDLPLVLDLDGEVWALRQVHAALRSTEGLLVHYGHGLGSAELGALTEAGKAERRAGSARPSSLAVSAFCYRLLVPLGRVRLAFDFDLDDVEAARNPMTASTAFLVRESFESGWGTGVLGIPATRLPEYRIQLRTRGQGSVAALDEIAHLYGVVGSIEIEHEGVAAEHVLEAIYAQANALLGGLIDRLPVLGDDRRTYEAALRVLLTFAGEQLTLVAGSIGLSASVGSDLAERILGLPLFDTGAATLISGHRIIDMFRRHFEDHHALHEAIPAFDWGAVLAPGSLALVRGWLDAHLQPSRVVLPASASDAAASEAAASQPAPAERRIWDAQKPMPLDVLAWNIEHWLEQLRPDPRMSWDKPLPPTRIWMAAYELDSGRWIEGGDTRVDVRAAAPLVERVCASPTAVNFAWLLLGIYAHLNAIMGPITNDHEIQFQVAVGEALTEGRLRLLTVSASELFGRD